MENRKEEATKIGIGAVVFNNLCTTLIKDQVFVKIDVSFFSEVSKTTSLNSYNISITFNAKARLYLSYVTGIVLKVGARLLGIEMPNKM